MPTYEYLCASCGNQWEETQRISEPALEVCPKCAKHTAKRQISAGNFILKGGGWYADAYSSAKPEAKEAKKETKTDDGGAAPAPAAKSETKSEAPPAKAAPAAAPAASSTGSTKES